ncbi:MAG: hypothetical protein ACPLRW_12295 [Moorellales bacterium]
MAEEPPGGMNGNAEEISSRIRDVLEAVGNDTPGLTVREIHLHLRTKGIIVGRDTVAAVLRRMAEWGDVEIRPNPNRKGGVCFHLPGLGIVQPSLFDEQIPRDEIEREERSGLDLWQADEAERERFAVSVMEEIARGHALEESYAREVREIAPLLAGENPVSLLTELAEWVVEDLNALCSEIRTAMRRDESEARRLIRELGFRRAKAESFLQRLLRLDRPVENVPGILDIPTVSQMLRGRRVALDSKRAIERLNERILGERVIELLTAPPNRHRAAVGSDASVGNVVVEHVRGSFIPPTPAVLFVAAAAMRVVDRVHMWHYWDYDLDPRELERYRDLDAALEGLLISPHLRREVVTDFRHLRSAAMELRQYREELRVVQGRSRWHPISNVPELHHPPEVSLVVRDGRIFPLVHRLDDYDGASAPDDVLYGEVVRREIRAFRDVFHQTAGSGPMGAVYAGAVKAPEYSWLAMVVFWYLYKSGKVPADTFYRPPLNDQAVVHLLFWGLAEKRRGEVFASPRNMLVTFRVLRRFSDIAFSPHPRLLTDPRTGEVRAVNEDAADDWEEYIRQYMEEANVRYRQHRRGIPALDDVDEYKPFLDLCYRAAVAMFYGVPARMYASTLDTNSHFLAPRWELAVDLTTDVRREVARRLEGLIAWLAEDDGLVPDESHVADDYEGITGDLPLFIPNVVMEAHRAVGYGRDRHAADVQDELRKLVADIRARRLPVLKP